MRPLPLVPLIGFTFAPPRCSLKPTLHDGARHDTCEPYRVCRRDPCSHGLVHHRSATVVTGGFRASRFLGYGDDLYERASNAMASRELLDYGNAILQVARAYATLHQLQHLEHQREPPDAQRHPNAEGALCHVAPASGANGGASGEATRADRGGGALAKRPAVRRHLLGDRRPIPRGP